MLRQFVIFVNKIKIKNSCFFKLFSKATFSVLAQKENKRPAKSFSLEKFLPDGQ
jgi:hypothetical protein